MKKGFTLMEVLVAFAGLSLGTLVFGKYLEGFNQLVAKENESAKNYLEVASAMEFMIENSLECFEKNNEKMENVFVSAKKLPGEIPLMYVTIEKSNVKLGRIVKCTKKDFPY